MTYNGDLTERGLPPLSMRDSSFPGDEHLRELLDRQSTAALLPEVFDTLASEANLL
ncbi:hypothetical protein [Pseudomonas sp. UBA2684]|uniref:hypothetical protein n=1 Tax=Pseudomonas sp. UBA2684 TaxID=1947311 RepID=UPI0025CD91EF|nr:hypothetical protein [Pseudomonas sp. UBA2684]|tara:strand:+ start:34718 stop:34885 length:168 start_codon:yes stop_codon:yes gene_type:complete